MNSPTSKFQLPTGELFHSQLSSTVTGLRSVPKWTYSSQHVSLTPAPSTDSTVHHPFKDSEGTCCRRPLWHRLAREREKGGEQERRQGREKRRGSEQETRAELDSWSPAHLGPAHQGKTVMLLWKKSKRKRPHSTWCQSLIDRTACWADRLQEL